MDDVRGTFGTDEKTDRNEDWDTPNSESAHDGPPASIGQDERRMQVRAYNHWAGLLGERNFPSIEELDPADIADFGPNSVLLDFSAGVEDPSVQYLGDKLGEECGAAGPIHKLSDVPARSLLSRITDHYMQILANQAPIGFEAEFVNHGGASILYRGILLPYSSDDETIDFIYGVINWKEMADQATADELLLEIDQALEAEEVDEDEAHKHPSDPVTEWAPSSLDDFDELSGLAYGDGSDAFAADNDTGSDGAQTPAADGPGVDGPAVDDNVFELDLEHIHESDGEQVAANDVGAAQNGEDSKKGQTASLLDIRGCDAAFEHEIDDDLPVPDFGQYKLEDPDEDFDEDDDFETGEDEAAYHFASLADYIETPTKKAIDLDAEMNVPEGYDPEGYDPEGHDPESFDGEDTGETRAQDEGFEDEPDALETGEPAPLELNGTLELESSDEADGEPALEVTDPVATSFKAPAELESASVGTAEYEQSPAQPADASDLHDCLASARELAQSAVLSEDRSRNALYSAVGRAYDFSIAAAKAPSDYEELIADSGLSVQERAPMTPIVKLVFGSEYDKTRLTEYAAVLAHAHRLQLNEGSLTQFLAKADGGLKGVVQAERRLRREESGKPVEPKDAPRASLAKKLRKLEAAPLADISSEGPEFALVMVRRDGDGNVVMIGEIGDDVPLIERAAKKLVG